MQIVRSVLLALVAGTLLGPATGAVARAQAAPTFPGVEEALGRKGAAQPGEVLKFSFPRSDLSVTADGVMLKPALALGSWAAFKQIGTGQSMAMGDLVLTEDEVGPVMRALQTGGIEQTAVHNHVLHESPRVMYVHFSAHGDPAKIARALRSALGESKTPMTTPAAPAAASAADLDTAGIARELGIAGKLSGVVYQVSVPRRERITDMGHEVPPSMGVATAINFQPTGGGKAAVTGDFVMRASEVNKVIRALQAHGITTTALHSHMLNEEPRLFFMHFWANDDAVTLAKGFRAALNETASKLGR
ncbi:MAG TPA: DUF1259 domain-containing protein [Gemmatimonadaceae bacterium]|nr:DUF1259 domain-containing protein [Gemmatimonadaceae bacterium]